MRTSAFVALLAEGVDRNKVEIVENQGDGVALLAEGVDRNREVIRFQTEKGVALLAEGVDRNDTQPTIVPSTLGRPPRGGRG